MARKDELIARYQLEPLVGEGGYFRFLCSFGTDAGAIFYLITPEEFSHMHVLSADELWFFLEGDACEQVLISPEGEKEKRILGPDARVSLVQKQYHQATRLCSGGGYALFSTVMSPRYQESLFQRSPLEIADRFPEVASLL